MTAARCPKCHIEIGATWRWCLACGYDPDGSAERVRREAIEKRRREGGWLPVFIVLVGLSIGGFILWRTTPDESTPTVSPSTAAEVTSWVSFSPPGAGFRVDLPSVPAKPTEQQTQPGKVSATYVVGGGGHLFTVMVADTGRKDLMPGRADDAIRTALHDQAQQLAGTVSGHLSAADMTSVGSRPALDFRIDDSILGHVRGRIVLVGTRLGTVSISARDLSDDIADHAINSLALT